MKFGIADIEACLPQTQCTRCEYPSCTDYASAIIKGSASINKCPPGGAVTIAKLAELTDQPIRPLDPVVGEFQPKMLAYIIENQCIGCVLCIKACPVDAIIGANKQMHNVIAEHCTGCELCLPVCPTDCIEMRATTALPEAASDWPGYTLDDIKLSKIRFERRQHRLARIERVETPPDVLDKLSRQQAILAAVNRRNKRNE